MAKKSSDHHGGAWKVAYADFVTAMMALFMVLWISAQDKEILIATSQYFQNPFRSPMDATSGVLPFNSNKSTQSEGKEQGSEKNQPDRNKQIQLTFLNSVAADFYRLLHLDQNLEGKPIDIQVTTDGLRVTLFDRAKRPLFANGSTELTEWGRFILQNLAWTIDRHKFRVTIDGHAHRALPAPAKTAPPGAAAAPIDDAGAGGYGIWELSADRANAARRALVHYALDPALIERVTGYANTRPLSDEAADAEAQERITLNLTLTVGNRFRDNKLVDKSIPVSPPPKAEP